MRRLRQHGFLIVLMLVLALGILQAELLAPLSARSWPQNSVAAVVLFLMAWPLDLRTIRRSLAQPGPALLAAAINFGLLPCFAWIVSLALSDEMGPGLLVAAATPCTLASAAVWTRRAGGNDAVAILVTILTNLLCFILTPLWLSLLTGRSVDRPELGFSRMALHLGLLVLLPMGLAQATRGIRRIAEWATDRKILLGSLAQFGILYMVLLGAVSTGVRLRSMPGTTLQVSHLAAMLAAVLLVHLAMFWVGIHLSRWLRFSREDQIAVGFAGSQKTLMVGLVVAMALQITILPMVSYHVLQLLVDTVIADRYRRSAAVDPTSTQRQRTVGSAKE
jgi:sodium/bile acid cotransporter 7